MAQGQDLACRSRGGHYMAVSVAAVNNLIHNTVAASATSFPSGEITSNRM